MFTQLFQQMRAKVETVLHDLFAHYFGEKIRRGSIQAVKAYIQGVQFARIGVLALFSVGLIGAVMISGLVLMIVGLVQLLPITPMAMAIAFLAFGFLMTVIPLVLVMRFFSEKRWLAASKSVELMDAVLAPWPGVMPPNPFNVVTKQAQPTAGTTPMAQTPVVETSGGTRSVPPVAKREQQPYPINELSAQNGGRFTQHAIP